MTPDGIPQLNADNAAKNDIEPDEDGDDDEGSADQPEVKRQRVESLVCKMHLLTKVGRTMAGQTSEDDLVEEELAYLNLLAKIRDRADVKHLIKEQYEKNKLAYQKRNGISN